MIDTKTYYGEYTLFHWIELMLGKNIILPEYQRSFVWGKDDVESFMDSISKNEFIPTVTIGAVKHSTDTINYILDGQQRLTSILMAYLEYFPDSKRFKEGVEKNFADDNDLLYDDADKEEDEKIMKWQFSVATGDEPMGFESMNGLKIKLSADNRYTKLKLSVQVDEQFLKSHYLGFSYIVPQTDDIDEQQTLYSNIFRNINIKGKQLSGQESRQALYFLKPDYSKYFDPDFAKDIIVNNDRFDFTRCLAILSRYKKNPYNVCYGYAKRMEDFYYEYINDVVKKLGNKDCSNSKFEINGSILKDYKKLYQRVEQICKDLNILKKNFNSIIEADVYFFGLLYVELYEEKQLDLTQKESISVEIEELIKKYKNPEGNHNRQPGLLKHLNLRLKESIELYEKYSK